MAKNSQRMTVSPLHYRVDVMSCAEMRIIGSDIILLRAHNACIADLQVPIDDAVPTTPFPVVFCAESKLVRTPGPAHPYMVVPSEVREIGCVSTMPDSSEATFVFPAVAVYCHPPSPTVSTPPFSASPSPIQYSPHCQSPTESPRSAVSNVKEAEAGVKQPVGARLSVPTESQQRRRAAGGGLSRSQSHPLHWRRHRSRPTNTSDADELSSRRQQTERLKNVVERTS